MRNQPSMSTQSEPTIDEQTIAGVKAIVAVAIKNKLVRSQDGDDLEQEILVRLWEKRENYDPNRACWSTYCAMIARTTISEHNKKKRSKRNLEFESLEAFDRSSGTGVTREFTEDDKVVSRTGKPRTEVEIAERNSEFASVIGRLPRSLQRVCKAIETCKSYE